jgi:hypothetical protein
MDLDVDVDLDPDRVSAAHILKSSTDLTDFPLGDRPEEPMGRRLRAPRCGRNPQRGGDLLRREASRQQLENFPRPRRERCHGIARLGRLALMDCNTSPASAGVNQVLPSRAARMSVITSDEAECLST